MPFTLGKPAVEQLIQIRDDFGVGLKPYFAAVGEVKHGCGDGERAHRPGLFHRLAIEGIEPVRRLRRPVLGLSLEHFQD